MGKRDHQPGRNAGDATGRAAPGHTPPQRGGPTAPDHDPQEASSAAFGSPDILASTKPDRQCLACGQTTVHVVIITALVVTSAQGSEEQPIGGWAVCSSCGAASPHPVLGEPDD